MPRKVNVALIGYQFMGKAHSNAYRQMPRFFESDTVPVMKVICGRNQAAVKAAADKFGWEEWNTSWEEVVRRKDIDVVDISTPGDSHMPIAIAAAKAGKTILCEKPLANTLSEAKKMSAVVQKAGVINMICHNYRKAPAVGLAQRMIAEEQLGKIYHFRGTYLQDWPLDPNLPLYWRFDKTKSGSGALGDLASHVVDLARFLVGEISEVSAALETFIKERPLVDNPKKKGKVTVDDTSLSLVRFANGAMGTIEATRMAPGRKNYNRFEINGSKGSLCFNLERMNELEVFLVDDPVSIQGFRSIMVTDPSHPYWKWWPAGHIIGYEHTFVHAVYDLMEAISKNKMPSPSFDDGLKNQQVLDAMERSAQSKKWVKV
ncbi:MAG: Gfo/Idh/MocA family oxidoreductase [Acidobacteriota bacterium]